MALLPSAWSIFIIKDSNLDETIINNVLQKAEGDCDWVTIG